jgi:protein-tyrosine phosphatase
MLHHINEIFDHLYLGDAGFIYENNLVESHVGNKVPLPELNFIVNCCPEVNIKYKNLNYKPDIVYLKFNDDPEESDKLLQILDTTKILEKMHDYISRGKNVLVHCAMGVQRSATIVACYLLKYYKADINTTILHIKHRRPQSFENGVNFTKVLQHFRK